MATDDLRNGVGGTGSEGSEPHPDQRDERGGPAPGIDRPRPRARVARQPAGLPERVSRSDSSDGGAVDIRATLETRARNKRVAPPYDPDTNNACPLFWQLVTQDQTTTGETAFLPELKLQRIAGGWTCLIRDVETSQETRFTFVALLDLARAAEAHLGSGNAVWLPYKNYRNPKGIERHDKKKT